MSATFPVILSTGAGGQDGSCPSPPPASAPSSTDSILITRHVSPSCQPTTHRAYHHSSQHHRISNAPAITSPVMVLETITEKTNGNAPLDSVLEGLLSLRSPALPLMPGPMVILRCENMEQVTVPMTNSSGNGGVEESGGPVSASAPILMTTAPADAGLAQAFRQSDATTADSDQNFYMSKDPSILSAPFPPPFPPPLPPPPSPLPTASFPRPALPRQTQPTFLPHPEPASPMQITVLPSRNMKRTNTDVEDPSPSPRPPPHFPFFSSPPPRLPPFSATPHSHFYGHLIAPDNAAFMTHAAAGAAESGKIQAEKLLVSIPTESLDPSSVIASDPAQARRLALTAARAASISTSLRESGGEEGEEGEEASSRQIINQQVALVPSQTSTILSQNQESRVKNLEKIPPEAVRALEATLSAIPAWGVRITKEKLEALGGRVLGSPVLMEGERSEQVVDYAPKNYHIQCRHCGKNFLGKNALRNFELHAIFWTLYRSHPAIVRVGHAAASAAAAAMGLQWARVSNAEGGGTNAGMGWAHGDMPGSMSESGGLACSSDANAGKQNMDGAVRAAAQVFEGHHQLNYPCNSVARDVVVFMEARKPVLCNNQKKIFMLRGNLHHDTSLFQNRAWLQIPASKTWESCKLADPTSLQDVLWCRGGKALEAYETLRSHIFAWHDSGVFTSCSHCKRVYQNTRAFLGHGCVKKSPIGMPADAQKDDTAVACCSQSMMSFLEVSPDFAQLFYQLRSLPSERREEVFDRVSKRLRSTNV